LIEGLESIQRCAAVLNPYWNTVVFPLAANGFQPRLGDGFNRFMHAPRIEKATEEFLAKRGAEAKTSYMDTHPPLKVRVERARRYNLPAPESEGPTDQTDLPMISVIDDLAALEASLLKRFMPDLAKTELKPLDWEKAGDEFYIPKWRKQVEGMQAALSTKTLAEFPGIVMDPRFLYPMAPNQSGKQLNRAQQNSWAVNVLYSAFALCLLDHDWKLHSEPGAFYLENGENKVDPGEVIALIKDGKLMMLEWGPYCAQRGIGGWPLTMQADKPAEDLQPAGQLPVH